MTKKKSKTCKVTGKTKLTRLVADKILAKNAKLTNVYHCRYCGAHHVTSTTQWWLK